MTSAAANPEYVTSCNTNCPFCAKSFDDGHLAVVTPCNHVFCLPCADRWWSRREDYSCPVCNVAVPVNRLKTVIIDENEPRVTGSSPVILPFEPRIITNEDQTDDVMDDDNKENEPPVIETVTNEDQTDDDNKENEPPANESSLVIETIPTNQTDSNTIDLSDLSDDTDSETSDLSDDMDDDSETWAYVEEGPTAVYLNRVTWQVMESDVIVVM